jgi:hypothetical protein
VFIGDFRNLDRKKRKIKEKFIFTLTIIVVNSGYLESNSFFGYILPVISTMNRSDVSRYKNVLMIRLYALYTYDFIIIFKILL